MTFRWPWAKVTAVTLINGNLLVCRIKWEPLKQSLQNVVAISPWSCLSPDKILKEFYWKFYFSQIFLENCGCVFSRSNTLLDLSQEWLVRLMWNEKGGALVGYWVNYVTLTFDLTHDLDLVVSRSEFEIALFEEWGADWHGMKGMWVNHSWPWLWPMGNHDGVGGCTI